MELDELVGRRVSVRQCVGERNGRPLYADAVGELTHDGAGLTVRTRRGPVAVRRESVVAVRAVPPAPPRRASLAAVARLEGLCADAWPAQADEPLGGWRLRAAGGYTGRANSALAIGDPGMAVPDALDVVRRFAVRHGIGPQAQVPTGSPWERAIEAAGWVLDGGRAGGAESAVLVAELDVLADPARPDPPGPAGAAGLPRVELPERPDPAWWTMATGGDASPAQRHVLDPGGAPVTAFAVLRLPDGTVGGQLRVALVQDHLHLSVLAVAPTARGGGLASMLLGAAARWGLARGARWAVLQSAQQNTGARGLYDRLGFREHHRYRYLVPDRGSP